METNQIFLRKFWRQRASAITRMATGIDRGRLATQRQAARRFTKRSAMCSKAWIDPHGTIIPNGGHDSWLLANGPKLKADYGLNSKKAPQDDYGIRLWAINNGFVRVNYENRDGTLTIEAGRAHWRGAAKDAVLLLVKENAPDISRIRVHVVDQKGKLVREGYADDLWRLDNAEKVEHIPLVTASVRGQAVLHALRSR